VKDVRTQLEALLTERILVNRGGTPGSPTSPLLSRIDSSIAACLSPSKARLRRWNRRDSETA
jgi:hypothetical protein